MIDEAKGLSWSVRRATAGGRMLGEASRIATGEGGSPLPPGVAFPRETLFARQMRYFIILALTMGAVVCAPGFGRAYAIGCPPIEAAAIKQAATPYHMIMDRAEEGGRHDELIQTATTTYALVKGNWISIPYDAQERIKDLKESGDEQKIACQNIGHNIVDGQQTDRYTAQTKSDDDTSSGDVWISSSTGLIVKEHMIHTEDGKKTTTDIRFDYTNVAAPSESKPLSR